MTNVRTTALLLALLGAAAACSGKSKDGEETIATVGSREISKAQFEAYLAVKRIPLDDQVRRENALAEFLSREALADAIEQQKSIDSAVIEAELREQKKELLISRYFEKLLEDKVSPEAIRGYYAANASKYEEKKAHVAHILFRVTPKMSEEERSAKLTAAQEAHSRLLKGEDFAAVAQAMSEDTVSGKKGGDLGFLREGSVDASFSEKVFAMKKDEISEPFTTGFGFHIVKVIEPAQTVKKPLEAVEGDIRYELRAETKQAEMKRLEVLVKVERKGGENAAATKKPTETEATASRD